MAGSRFSTRAVGGRITRNRRRARRRGSCRRACEWALRAAAGWDRADLGLVARYHAHVPFTPAPPPRDLPSRAAPSQDRPHARPRRPPGGSPAGRCVLEGECRCGVLRGPPAPGRPRPVLLGHPHPRPRALRPPEWDGTAPPQRSRRHSNPPPSPVLPLAPLPPPHTRTAVLPVPPPAAAHMHYLSCVVSRTALATRPAAVVVGGGWRRRWWHACSSPDTALPPRRVHAGQQGRALTGRGCWWSASRSGRTPRRAAPPARAGTS